MFPRWHHICADPHERAEAEARQRALGADAARLFSLYADYHDREWGVPCHDEARLFELLILEGMQAGLSWLTILARREALREAFAAFDPAQLIRFGESDIAQRLADPRIIRNRRKIEAVIRNARALLALHERGESLSALLWSSVEGRPVVNHWRTHMEIPTTTPLAQRLAKELARRGFVFVGPTIVYSLLQAAGLVNDHLLACPRHAACVAYAGP